MWASHRPMHKNSRPPRYVRSDAAARPEGSGGTVQGDGIRAPIALILSVVLLSFGEVTKS